MEIYTVMKIKTKKDSNGNPRRFYMTLGTLYSYIVFTEKEVIDLRGRCEYTGIYINVAPAEFKRIYKEGRKI